jgi:hypothetical protein
VTDATASTVATVDPLEALRFQLRAIVGGEPSSSSVLVRHRDNAQFAERFIPVDELYGAAVEIQKRGQACDVYLAAAPRSGQE